MILLAGNCLLGLYGDNNSLRVQHWPTYIGFTKLNIITIEYPGLLNL